MPESRTVVTRLLLSLFALGVLMVLAACAKQDDGLITFQVKSKLAKNPQIKTFRIDVVSQNGVVTLTGQVEKEEQRTEAEQVARSTQGVKDVVNGIQVGKGTREGGRSRAG